MNEKQIESALIGLAEQRPHIPEKCIEQLARTAALLNKERLRHLGQTAEKKPQHRELTAKKPEKDKNRSL